ncbi:MAG: hypothetical protein ABI210_06850, partial [Abditibacteriaceae bacterium]
MKFWASIKPGPIIVSTANITHNTNTPSPFTNTKLISVLAPFREITKHRWLNCTPFCFSSKHVMRGRRRRQEKPTKITGDNISML